MKSFITIIFVACFAFGSEYILKPEKVDDGLWCLFADLMPPTKDNKGFVSNVCWVENGDALTLLDAGPTTLFAKELEKAIAHTTTKKITTVVVTNYHDDRILGASYFQSRGAKIVAHKNILLDIQSNPQKYMRLEKLLTKEQYAGTKLPEIDTVFDSKSYTLGSIELYKLSDIAETPSDIIVYMPKQKAIFTGNILFGERGLNYDKDSNINGWLEALYKIESFEIEHFIPGHGTKTDSSSFEVTNSYLTKLYKQTKEAYENDVELEDLSKTVPMDEFSYLINYKPRHIRNLYNLYEHMDFEKIK